MSDPAPTEWHPLCSAALDGTITGPEKARFATLLKTSAEARQLWFLYTDNECGLAELKQQRSAPQVALSKPRSRWLAWRPLAAAAAAMVAMVAMVALAGGWWLSSRPATTAEVVARFGALQDCRWVNAGMRVAPGDGVHRGQRVELSAGRAEVVFGSGAVVTLIGPCVFDAESAKGGFLMLGQIKTLAATPESKGFTVRTRTARFVDVGTEFVAGASADGQSRVDVTSGEVLVHLDGIKAPHRLRKGDALSIEAGSAQVMVRIESGDETPAFHVPSIEPPSDRDYADAKQGHAVMLSTPGARLSGGRGASGPLELLLDGKGQSRADAPEESVFFQDGPAGLLLLDLGQAVTISRINTYSWHQHGLLAGNRIRAVQKFTLYGFAGDERPAVDGPLTEAGWVPIARVNSDDFFGVVKLLDRPAQQACSISGAHGTIGRYRYLLWETQPSFYPNLNFLNHTFYGEFDVYAEPR
jgi:ferric-dicitrate binding protein FerR (iron transport regulator)